MAKGRALRPVRGLVADIDRQLGDVDKQLGSYEDLLKHRARLVEARAVLLGERRSKGPGARRISQREVIEFVGENPGAQSAQIAAALDAPVARISQHLYRGKEDLFEMRGGGWHLRGGVAK